MEKRPLIQIVYTSLVSDRVDAGEFFAMVQGASRKFASMGITGRLIFADGRFFQALEGPPLNLDLGSEMWSAIRGITLWQSF